MEEEIFGREKENFFSRTFALHSSPFCPINSSIIFSVSITLLIFRPHYYYYFFYIYSSSTLYPELPGKSFSTAIYFHLSMVSTLFSITENIEQIYLYNKYRSTKNLMPIHVTSMENEITAKKLWSEKERGSIQRFKIFSRA